jgi:hypothetical protein
MAMKHIKSVGSYKELYVCDRTGIAVVRDGSTGMSHSAHPNIDASGSVRGMKRLGYWGKKDTVVRTNGAIYNVSLLRNHTENKWTKIATMQCKCGNH